MGGEEEEVGGLDAISQVTRTLRSSFFKACT